MEPNLQQYEDQWKAWRGIRRWHASVKQKREPGGSNMKQMAFRWEHMNLPDSLEGRTVLEVGCWAGGLLTLAKEHGAGRALGVDLYRSPHMHDIEFLQLDLFSDTFLQLPRFDIVLCFGVLYHMHDPVGCLLRLRHCCKGTLYLGTAALDDDNGEPRMHAYSAEDPTNWFLPNPSMVFEMLHLAGFEGIKLMHLGRPAQGNMRIIVRAEAARSHESIKRGRGPHVEEL